MNRKDQTAYAYHSLIRYIKVFFLIVRKKSFLPSFIDAGSVVTKNIPADEVWASNPARFIKKRAL